MEKNEILQTGESASAPTRCQAIPSNRILVVDDDKDIRQVNLEVLRRFGYQTDTAADGAAAWERLHAQSYDLLITDNNLPKVSGVELVKKVRSARLTLPVILATRALPIEELERNPWLQPSGLEITSTHRKSIIGQKLGVSRVVAQVTHRIR